MSNVNSPGTSRSQRFRPSLSMLVLAAAVAVVSGPGVGSATLFGCSSQATTNEDWRSDDPSDDALTRSGLLPEPLTPVGQTTPGEDLDLSRALRGFDVVSHHRTDIDEVAPLQEFLAAHPDSAWTPMLLVDLGVLYRRTGHLSQALETWQRAWDRTKNLTDHNGAAVGDAAVAYLSQFEAYLGRKETLQPLLEEIATRPIRGTAVGMIRNSRMGLAEMLTRPADSFKCGPAALRRILDRSDVRDKQAARRILHDAQSTPRGLSLTAVQAFSAQAGMNYQMAFRSPGAPVLLPAVTHWNVGHYAALLLRQIRISIAVRTARIRTGT
jgi:hypothetical protein